MCLSSLSVENVRSWGNLRSKFPFCFDISFPTSLPLGVCSVYECACDVCVCVWVVGWQLCRWVETLLYYVAVVAVFNISPSLISSGFALSLFDFLSWASNKCEALWCVYDMLPYWLFTETWYLFPFYRCFINMCMVRFDLYSTFRDIISFDLITLVLLIFLFYSRGINNLC